MASHALPVAMPVPPLADSFAAPALHIETCDWRAFQTPASVARWDALAQWAAEPNPFHEAWFLLPALRAFDPDAQVRLLCFQADGELAGLLPVHREWNYYGYSLPHWRGWRHPNGFLGQPLVAKGFEMLFWQELLRWADRNAGTALFLHLPQLPAEGPLQRALKQVLASERRLGVVVQREERAMLASPLTPEEYLEDSLGAKKRKELRRQHRRLAEEGTLEVERLETPLGVAEWAREFLALELGGWKGRAGSAMASDPRTETLFVEALAGAARRGKLERLAIRLDGRAIAMLATFISAPGAYSFKTAFDEGYARFSPGVLLQRENLDLLERGEVAWTDSCAAADHPMIDHFWRERRAITSVNLAVGSTPRRALFHLLAKRERGTPIRDYV